MHIASIEDDIAKQNLAMVSRGGKITKELFVLMIKSALSNMSNPVGEVSFEKLREISKGSKLEDIPISNDNIKSFVRHAEKYKISFALKEDKENNQQIVIFKSKDNKAIEYAFKDYMQEQLEKKESIKVKMQRNKEIIKEKQKDDNQKIKNKELEISR